MIRLDMPQGSEEWFAARMGVATGSDAGRVITPTGKPSSQAGAYAAQLAGDSMVAGGYLSEPETDEFRSEWMLRGQFLEPRARALFEFITDREVDIAGFIYQDERRDRGCSPDGLLGYDDGLEIKCPKLYTHMWYLYDNQCPPKYYPQTQFNMMVTGARRWQFMSYHPDVAPLIVTVKRDEKFIAAMGPMVDNVITIRNNIMEKIRAVHQ